MTEEQCPCGTLNFPIGREHIQSGSYIIVSTSGSDYDVDLRHEEVAYIETEQKFSTISKALPSSSIVPTAYTIHLGSQQTLTGSIRVTLSTTDGDILAQKYINDHDDSIVLSEIIINECNFVENQDLNSKEIVLNIFSVCERRTQDCCEQPPASITLSNQITSFCI